MHPSAMEEVSSRGGEVLPTGGTEGCSTDELVLSVRTGWLREGVLMRLARETRSLPKLEAKQPSWCTVQRSGQEATPG